MEEKQPTGYTFRRGKDGVDDVLEILDPEGKVITAIRYWDEPDTYSELEAKQSAQIICTHLNRWYTGKDTRFRAKDWRACLNGETWPAAYLTVYSGARLAEVPLVKLQIEPCDVGTLDVNLVLPRGYDVRREGESVMAEVGEMMLVGVNHLIFTNLDEPEEPQP